MIRKIDLSCPDFQRLVMEVRNIQERHLKETSTFYNFDFLTCAPKETEPSRFEWKSINPKPFSTKEVMLKQPKTLSETTNENEDMSIY